MNEDKLKTENFPLENNVGVKKYTTNLINKISSPVKTKLANFYANKLVFWPITIALGLVFLVILLGVMFGPKRTAQNTGQPVTKNPVGVQVEATPVATSSNDVLSSINNQLKSLKERINSLDVKESRLQPPQVDFKISF